VGFFFILAGAIFITNPNLPGNVVEFFQPQNFEVVRVPSTQVYLPAPKLPNETYVTICQAGGLFSLLWAFFEIAMLIIRVFAGSPLRKKVDGTSNVAFWLGAYYLIGLFLDETVTQPRWFAFWAAIVVLIGVTLLVRAVIWAAMDLRSR
jgi:hypothetical protein